MISFVINIISATRPKTLSAGITPVMIGIAIASKYGSVSYPIASLCIIGVLLIQIGTNLANDYFDFKKGADTSERLGPTRVTQAGLLTERQIFVTFCLVFFMVLIVGAILGLIGGWPIWLLAILSVFLGVIYTAGPFPLAYLGLGDIFVLIFFGPVASGMTTYVLRSEYILESFFWGIAPGAISVAILAVNNLRDRTQDARVNKQTLAVRFGAVFVRWEITTCLILSLLWPLLSFFLFHSSPGIFLVWLLSPLVVSSCYDVFYRDAGDLNKTLAKIGVFLFFYGVFVSLLIRFY